MATTDLSISGLATGFDWKSVVTQLANAERSPEVTWKQNQTRINGKNTAFDRIKTFLNALQTDVKALKDPALYGSRNAVASNTAVASATAATNTAAGIYSFNISQLATAAKINGTSDMGQAISADGDLSAVVVGTANFSSAISEGTFTVNGKQITIATTDTLQTVANNISTATGGVVSLGYDTATDKFSLTSSDGSAIVLGSAADNSNFLSITQLYNNGIGVINSASSLGRLQLGDTLASADFKTAVTPGAGQFKINGVAISYDTTTDTIQTVLDRINSSTAGVAASYDLQNDRFVLANKVTGDIGIGVEDVTGNFLAASGLAASTLVHGQNLHYTLNGGAQQLVSQTNSLSSDSSSITGLTVNALTTGTVDVTVGNNNSKVSDAIKAFIKDYNSVQSYVATQTASSTDSTGNVTAGILAADQDANALIKNLRSLSFSPISGLTSTLNQLASLGIKTNGKDNTIELSDSSALDNALNNTPEQVRNFFADSTNGLAVQLDTYLTNTTGDSGTLTNHMASLTKQSSSIDSQISLLEKTITTDSAQWTKAFQAMETAQAQITQQMNYLTQAINKGSL